MIIQTHRQNGIFLCLLFMVMDMGPMASAHDSQALGYRTASPTLYIVFLLYLLVVLERKQIGLLLIIEKDSFT